VALLFIDFERPNRLRVNGVARMVDDDPMLRGFPGAQFIVRVRAARIFPNCPRYIHRMTLAETSPYVPRDGYTPPVRDRNCYAAGRDARAALRAAIYNLQQGGYASEYDAYISGQLAHILCGGALSSGQWVDEQYLLDLEREVFVELLAQPKTLERIQHMLSTGKPLRN